MVKPPPVEVVACSQVFRVCGFLCSLVSGCYSFALCISVSIVLDSHVISVTESFSLGVLLLRRVGACQNYRLFFGTLYSYLHYMLLM